MQDEVKGQIKYWKEGEQLIKLGDMENQILQLSITKDDGKDDDEVRIDLSAGEKVYRNDVVSMEFKV